MAKRPSSEGIFYGFSSAIESIACMWRTASGGLGQRPFPPCSGILVLVEFILRINE
jgi:hypothetical protein